jgi:hypothetical protein
LHVAAFHAHRNLVELFCAAAADINARISNSEQLQSGRAIELHVVKSHDVEWTRRLVQRMPPAGYFPNTLRKPEFQRSSNCSRRLATGTPTRCVAAS